MADNGGDDRKSDEGTCTDSDDSAGASNDSPETDQPTPGVSLSLDATLELLAHSDRRAILDYLLDAEDSTATVGELADYLVAKKPNGRANNPVTTTFSRRSTTSTSRNWRTRASWTTTPERRKFGTGEATDSKRGTSASRAGKTLSPARSPR
ncbi:hypothetical protein [Halorussus caseinilyticus]|uniref:ArsR family transcriptional regulator n=1 Tax=Halorussus caseinilyticus TaxID=3034025 RepID=A0ABD5WK68_9EURY